MVDDITLFSQHDVSNSISVRIVDKLKWFLVDISSLISYHVLLEINMNDIMFIYLFIFIFLTRGGMTTKIFEGWRLFLRTF